jgi:oligopeptide/dipeptide ABC transporter ATP-binding protein
MADGIPTIPAGVDEPSSLLAVRDLTVAFPTATGASLAANAVSFDVLPRETLGLVGESGCGKSATLRSLIGLTAEPGAVVDGTITWKGRTIDARDRERLSALRGGAISMIFQDPMASLNPVYSIGYQLVETLTRVARLSRPQARRRAVELLDRVGIADARRRMSDYPHLLSGGMRQRVMIALALATGPELLLADEPTTALDVTIQFQILTLLRDIQDNTGMSIIIVSHDLGVVAHVCDRVAVMYAGFLVEQGSTADVLRSPRHPYASALVNAMPEIASAHGERLVTIDGQAPALDALPEGCPFIPRCTFSRPACSHIDVVLDRRLGEHQSACPIVPSASRVAA